MSKSMCCETICHHEQYNSHELSGVHSIAWKRLGEQRSAPPPSKFQRNSSKKPARSSDAAVECSAIDPSAFDNLRIDDETWQFAVETHSAMNKNRITATQEIPHHRRLAADAIASESFSMDQTLAAGGLWDRCFELLL